MTSFATKPFRSARAAASSVAATYRAAAAYERSPEAATGQRILVAVTSGPYRTLV